MGVRKWHALGWAVICSRSRVPIEVAVLFASSQPQWSFSNMRAGLGVQDSGDEWLVRQS